MSVGAPPAHWHPTALNDPTTSWMIAQQPATATLMLEECRGHDVVPNPLDLWIVLVALRAALVVMPRAYVRASVAHRARALGPARTCHAVHRASHGLPKKQLLRRREELGARILTTDVSGRIPQRGLFAKRSWRRRLRGDVRRRMVKHHGGRRRGSPCLGKLQLRSHRHEVVAVVAHVAEHRRRFCVVFLWPVGHLGCTMPGPMQSCTR